MNGGNHGYETSGHSRFSSVNMSQDESGEGGFNQVSMSLALSETENKDFNATIKKESAIIPPSWQPSYFESVPSQDFQDESMR